MHTENCMIHRCVVKINLHKESTMMLLTTRGRNKILAYT